MYIYTINNITHLSNFGSVEDDQAKKTLLAIIRERWPVGRYTFTDIDDAHPKWLENIVKEFKVGKNQLREYIYKCVYIYICFVGRD